MERQYILDAIDAALCAGKDILSIYNDPTSDFQIEKKADNSPLTIADKKAHAAIAGYLQKKALSIIERGGKAFALYRAMCMDYFMDCRPSGWYQRVYQTEWRVYR